MSDTDRPDDEDRAEDQSNPFHTDGRRDDIDDEFSGLNRYGGNGDNGDRDLARDQDGNRRESNRRDRRRQNNGDHSDQSRSPDDRGRINTPQSGPDSGRSSDSGNRRAGGSRRKGPQRGPPADSPSQGGSGPGKRPDTGGNGSPPPATGRGPDDSGPTGTAQPDLSKTPDTLDGGGGGGVLGSLMSSNDTTQSYDTYQWTTEDDEALTQTLLAMHQREAPLLEIRPPRDSEGMRAFEGILKKIHETDIERGRNVSEQHAHEVWYNGGQVRFHFQPSTRARGNQMQEQIQQAYPNAGVSEVVTTQETVKDLFPVVNSGDYVAAARFDLRRPFYYPIRSVLDNEQEPFNRDPYSYILSDMGPGGNQTEDGERVHNEDVRLLIQVVLEPARDDWSKGGLYGIDVDNIAHDLKENRLAERSTLGLGKIPLLGILLTHYEEREPNRRQRREAELVASVKGKAAYHMSVRVLAISQYERYAQQRARFLAQNIETYYNSFSEQGLVAESIDPGSVSDFLLRAATRRHKKARRHRIARLNSNKLVQPVDAVAGMVHLPEGDINLPGINWATQDVGPGVPSDAGQGEEELAEMYEDDGDDGRFTAG